MEISLPSGRSIQRIDYYSKNKVIDHGTAVNQNKFHTDHKRIVLSAGGIMPDTVVKNESGSRLIQTLLAEGMFFRFATNYFNTNPKLDLEKISDDKLLKEFTEYLKNQNYQFVSRSEKLLDQLKVAGLEENIDPALLEPIEKIKSKIDATHSNELNKYKEDSIFEIRQELVSRVSGRQGRITEALRYDKQFHTAVSILSDKRKYDGLLH